MKTIRRYFLGVAWVHLWDIFAWILIAFPALTGGIWIKKPGIFIELSELAIPTLIVSLLALVLKICLKVPLERSSFVRIGLSTWSSWCQALARCPKRVLWGSTLAWGAVLAWASLRRHQAFASSAADLGIFGNAIWNLVFGEGYVSSLKGGVNLFTDHQSPIFWAVAPFFWFAPRPETLLVIQALALVCGGPALWYLGKQFTLKNEGSALPLLYWAYLPMRTANAFDFHPETFLLPLFLWATLGLQSADFRKRFWGALALIGALGCKESAPLVIMGLGISWALGAGPSLTHVFTRRLGFVLIPLGLVVFIIDTQFVPGWFGGKYVYGSFYSELGGPLDDLVLARLKFLYFTLAPLAFLPLLNPKAAIAALPGYLILFLSTGNHRLGWIYHYAIESAAGLFFALPGGLKKALKLTGTNSQVALWILFWALMAFGRNDLYRIRSYEPSSHHEWLRTQALPCLTSVSIAAPGALVPHLIARPWVRDLPNLEARSGLVDCVIWDQSLNNWPLTAEELHTLPVKFEALGYQNIYSCGTFNIFEREGRSCLSCQPECP